MKRYGKSMTSGSGCRILKTCAVLLVLILCRWVPAHAANSAAPSDSIPPSRIADLKKVVVTGNSVTVTWTAPGWPKSTGAISFPFPHWEMEMAMVNSR